MQPELQKAFENTAAQYIIITVPDMPDHIFSKGFEKKMKHLIKYGELVSKGKITVKKLYICVIAAILAVSLMAFSVGAVRDFFKNFFMEIFDTHTEVQSADYKSAPASIENIYTIEIPNGYVLSYEDELYEWSPFISHEYYNGDEYLFFSQYAKPSYNVNVNTENHPLEYMSINGYDGFIIDLGNNEYLITWDNGDYVFELIGNIGENALIKLAGSVQKAEN